MSDAAQKIGQSLKRLRKERGWSAEEIVDGMQHLGDVKMNTSQLSRHENGHKKPTAVRLQFYADLYGVSKASIESGRPDKAKSAGDLMDSLADARRSPSLRQVEDRIVALETKLLARLGAVQSDLEDLRSHQGLPARSQADTDR